MEGLGPRGEASSDREPLEGIQMRLERARSKDSILVSVKFPGVLPTRGLTSLKVPPIIF